MASRMKRKFYRDYLRQTFLVILVAWILKTFVLGGYKITYDQMSPTLLAGDFILINRISILLGIESLDRGDVVVYNHKIASQPQVSRILALPGDHLEIKKGQLFLNGLLLFDQAITQMEPFVVPPDSVVVWDDAPDGKEDPQNEKWGEVSMSKIQGRVFLIWFSVDWKNNLIRKERFFRLIRNRPFSSIKENE